MNIEVDIRAPRLRIVTFKRHHITKDYVGWLNDQTLMRYSNQRFLRHSDESCAHYLASFDGADHMFLAIERAADSELMGTLTVNVDARHGRADLGILIGHPAAKGQGYGLEAWISTMSYLFEVRAIRKITAGAMAENSSMCKLAQRAGMKRDGLRMRHNILDGREVDVIHFAAFRGGWHPESPPVEGEHRADPVL